MKLRFMLFTSYFFILIPAFVVAMGSSEESSVGEDGLEISVGQFDVEIGEMGRKFKNKVYGGFSNATKQQFQDMGIKKDIKQQIEDLYFQNKDKYDQLMINKNQAKQSRKSPEKKVKRTSKITFLETQLALQKETAALRDLVLAGLASQERREKKRLEWKLVTAIASGGLALTVAIIEAGVFTAAWFLTQDDDSSGC